MMQLNADTTTDTTTTTTTTTGASGEADGRVLRVAEGLESPFDVKMMHASKQPTCQSTVFIFLVLGGELFDFTFYCFAMFCVSVSLEFSVFFFLLEVIQKLEKYHPN